MGGHVCDRIPLAELVATKGFAPFRFMNQPAPTQWLGNRHRMSLLSPGYKSYARFASDTGGVVYIVKVKEESEVRLSILLLYPMNLTF